MNLKDLYTEIDYLSGQMHGYAASVQGVFERTKSIIRSCLTECNDKECTIEIPCERCLQLKRLDKEIDKIIG